MSSTCCVCAMRRYHELCGSLVGRAGSNAIQRPRAPCNLYGRGHSFGGRNSRNRDPALAPVFLSCLPGCMGKRRQIHGGACFWTRPQIAGGINLWACKTTNRNNDLESRGLQDEVEDAGKACESTHRRWATAAPKVSPVLELSSGAETSRHFAVVHLSCPT